MVDKRFGLITKNPEMERKEKKTEATRLYPLLVHDIDGPINWHLKEQLAFCEKEGNAGDACRTYVSRRKVWEAIRKEVSRENQYLTTYSFRHRYAYCDHNRPKADGSYRAPKQIADAMGHSLDIHLLTY